MVKTKRREKMNSVDSGWGYIGDCFDDMTEDAKSIIDDYIERKIPEEKQYITIDDKYINMIWQCDNCGEKASIHPDFYQENGTPICDRCDNDMDYIKTEIEKIVLIKSGILTEV
jgi:hypothetical protein